MITQIRNEYPLNTKQLKDSELNEKVKSLARQERKLTQVILEHIAEVDQRKLFLKMAYPSLFDYLTKEIGYSAGGAQRRIDAARLLQKIPDVGAKIENGSLNLSQISRLQQVCRQIKGETGARVSVEVQKEVLNKIEHLSSRDTDLRLAQEFNIKINTQVKTQIQRDESMRIELTFSKEEMAVINEAQAALSHKTGGGLKEAFLVMAKETLKARSLDTNPTATMEVKSVAKSVTPRMKKFILNRDKHCQFIDLKTGRKCGSRHFLEVDHIVPRFVGGNHGVENLRILCKGHNNYRYEAMI